MSSEQKEKEVLETLKEIVKVKPKRTVLVGGYAINAYVLPRFSIDCDLVVLDDAKSIEKVLIQCGFKLVEEGNIPYGNYLRYGKGSSGEKISFDLLIGSVYDRQSSVSFEKEIFKRYSKERITVGRAVQIQIKTRIADPELLFAMKFVTARRQDIRDIFMLASTRLNRSVVKSIVKTKLSYDLIKKRVRVISEMVNSSTFRDSLQSAHGRLPESFIVTARKKLLKVLEDLKTD